MAAPTAQFCNTPETLAPAIEALKAAPHVFLDCEGKDLGRQGGKLSIITLGTPHAERVFLLDATTLSRDDMKPISDLLMDEAKTKYVWDGRMDFLALRDTFNISLPAAGVTDLQLVDILSRNARGEGEEKRLQRMATRMHPISQLRNLKTEGIHGLLSMYNACREHDIMVGDVRNSASKVDFNAFLHRPLRTDLQAYAVSDIRMLSRILAHFEESGYPTDTLTIHQQTHRYLRTVQDSSKASEWSSNLLFLEVLQDGGTQVATCEHCQRSLSEDSFVHKRINRTISRQGSCRVCHILNIRRKLQMNAELQRERDYDYDYDYESDGYN